MEVITLDVPNGIGIRLARADQHLKLLNTQVSEYASSNLHGLRSERGGEEGQWNLIAVVAERFDELGWPLLVSEVVHHWRSALENLVFMLSMLHRSGQVRGTGFPIFLNESDYRGKRENGPGPRQIRALPPAAQTIIESLQPWHTGKHDPLWMLHELSNADKHRLPQFIATVFEDAKYTVEPLPGVEIAEVEFFYGPFEDGTHVGSFTIRKTDPKASVNVKLDFTGRIAFGEGTNDRGEPLPTNGKPLMETLVLMRDVVWGTVRALQVFFDTPLIG